MTERFGQRPAGVQLRGEYYGGTEPNSDPDRTWHRSFCVASHSKVGITSRRCAKVRRSRKYDDRFSLMSFAHVRASADPEYKE
jgi:hypothetical protein